MYCCIYSGIESDDDMQNQILSCIDELGVKEVNKSFFLSMLCCVKIYVDSITINHTALMIMDGWIDGCVAG
jgi:hypothetical protein